jgi:hypothetical protein
MTGFYLTQLIYTGVRKEAARMISKPGRVLSAVTTGGLGD